MKKNRIVKKDTVFTKEAEKVHMTARERDVLRERIVSYMEYHPLHMPVVPKVQSFQYYAARTISSFGSWTMRARSLASAAAVFLFIAIPVAAEQALPGDALYPVKVRLNEGIRAQLTFSPYEKMQWETKRIERRVAEARLLAQEGNLTEEKEEVLEATAREHASSFQAQLAEMRVDDEEGAALAEVALESALEVQSAVLASDADVQAFSTTTNGGNVNGLAEIVRTARNDVASSATSTPSYERLIGRVEENTTRMYVLVDSLNGELTEAQEREVMERTARVDADIIAAKEAYVRGEHDAAVATLRHVLATTEKLIAFLNSIDIRASVSLQALVPSTESATVQILYDELATLASRRAAVEVSMIALGETISTELDAFDAEIMTAEGALAADNVVDGEAAIDRAKDIMLDLEVRVSVGEGTGTTTPSN
ncbi:MAG: hypothetical protein KBD21_04380 [Candidatus Pacebacteria bacterium]|nr:hypothetical protein [Candidatus Paceibacterota bacterium]